jgi:hypothetical protein
MGPGMQVPAARGICCSRYHLYSAHAQTTGSPPYQEKLYPRSPKKPAGMRRMFPWVSWISRFADFSVVIHIDQLVPCWENPRVSSSSLVWRHF